MGVIRSFASLSISHYHSMDLFFRIQTFSLLYRKVCWMAFSGMSIIPNGIIPQNALNAQLIIGNFEEVVGQCDQFWVHIGYRNDRLVDQYNNYDHFLTDFALNVQFLKKHLEVVLENGQNSFDAHVINATQTFYDFLRHLNFINFAAIY